MNRSKQVENRRSAVWESFFRLSDTLYGCKTCSAVIKSKDTSNLKRHLSAKHESKDKIIDKLKSMYVIRVDVGETINKASLSLSVLSLIKLFQFFPGNKPLNDALNDILETFNSFSNKQSNPYILKFMRLFELDPLGKELLKQQEFYYTSWKYHISKELSHIQWSFLNIESFPIRDHMLIECKYFIQNKKKSVCLHYGKSINIDEYIDEFENEFEVKFKDKNNLCSCQWNRIEKRFK